MREGIISTQQVRATQDLRAVEVIATLDAGEIIPGMFLHIPLNRVVDVTLRITEVVSQGPKQIRLVLDCDNDSEETNLVLALNFEDETLWVSETGEK